MENFWKKAVTTTGPVAVAGFILTLLIENIFRDKVLEMFGTDRAFYITMALIFVLAIAFILSIAAYRSSSANKRPAETGQVRVAEIKNSKVEGDVVLGDKIIGKDR